VGTARPDKPLMPPYLPQWLPALPLKDCFYTFQAALLPLPLFLLPVRALALMQSDCHGCCQVNISESALQKAPRPVLCEAVQMYPVPEHG